MKKKSKWRTIVYSFTQLHASACTFCFEVLGPVRRQNLTDLIFCILTPVLPEKKLHTGAYSFTA